MAVEAGTLLLSTTHSMTLHDVSLLCRTACAPGSTVDSLSFYLPTYDVPQGIQAAAKLPFLNPSVSVTS